MILYYVVGEGLGHLARAAAFLYTRGIDPAQTIVFSDSPYAKQILPGVRTIKIPADLKGKGKDLGLWLRIFSEQWHITEIYIDSYPLGLWGEWDGFALPGTDMFYISKLLLWDKYLADVPGKAPLFKRVFVLEEVRAEQNLFIVGHAEGFERLRLQYPPAELPEGTLEAIGTIGKPLWIVAHPGPAEEVKILWNRAEKEKQGAGSDAEITVICQHKPAGLPKTTRCLDIFPVYPFFEKADRIFTSGGFNIMQQTRKYWDKHVILPMAREYEYDDQAMRARGWEEMLLA